MYCAFLGHQPHISLAELHAVVPDMSVKKVWNKRIATFHTAAELDNEWLSRVGGTVLIAREIKSGKECSELEKIIPQVLYQELKHLKRKATFSFRCFGIERSRIRSLYKSCKQHLKDHGMPSRYIGNERNPAKPGTLMLRGIPGPSSCELAILRAKEGRGDSSGMLWVGKTCAVQDIESYSDRDMNKPFRDTVTGLMPPKLAQVMLNFGVWMLSDSGSGTGEKGTGKNFTVWDPFCGSGVIVMEALIRRMRVLASDKSIKAIEGCRKNIKWLRKKEKTPKIITSEIWKHNAAKKCDLPRKADIVVTETTLGPPLKKTPTKRDVKKFISAAEKLELEFFENMLEIVPDAPITCCFPVYITRDGTKHFLPRAIEKIKKLGYRLTCVRDANIQTTRRHTLLYVRPDQYVGREILCFLPPKK